jgi:predicted transcriptional regulator of viral defense system
MEIRDTLGLPTTFPSGPEIIEHLFSMGLASSLPVELSEKSRGASPSKGFILLGIQESRELDIDPLELLQSYNQEGTICYFTALAYFNLTTQVPVHHHIATLTKPIQNTNLEQQESASKNVLPQNTIKKSKIGTHIFTYGGVPFYSVKRVINSIPGIKTRIISPRTNIRITTVEQTLLDTLQYPIHCGGPEVIIEAWKLYINNLNEDLIRDYLKKIQIDPLTRRVGATLDLLDHPPTKNLDSFLKESRERIFFLPYVPNIPLFRGINFRQNNHYWKVLIP